MKYIVHSYNNFGFREVWLRSFFRYGYIKSVSTLGSMQIKAFKLWLLHANLIDNKKKDTEFSAILVQSYTTLQDIFIFIIPILYYSSGLIRYFTDYCHISAVVHSDDLLSNLQLWGGYSLCSSKNILYCFFNTILSFNELKSVNMFTFLPRIAKTKSFIRNPIQGVKYEHIVYLLYLIQEKEQRSIFALDEYPNEFGKCSIKKLFGLEAHQIYDIISKVDNQNKRIIKNYDVNAIEIYSGVSSLEILQRISQR